MQARGYEDVTVFPGPVCSPQWGTWTATLRLCTSFFYC